MKNHFLLQNISRYAILIVDDEEINRDILANIFENQHKILQAENGKEGLEVFKEHANEVGAILLDVQMEVMDGLEMLGQLAKENIPDRIPIFLITGEKDSSKINSAYDLGVMDVISKPISPTIVQKRVYSVMELFAARNHFQEMVDAKTAELAIKNIQLKNINTRLSVALAHEKEFNQGMIEALATATEFRSSESGEHVRRIYGITKIFLTSSPLKTNYNDEEINQIASASILHDVGKISIPDRVLNKPGRLTDAEFDVMKEHTVNGEKLLTQIPQLRKLPFYEHACQIAKYHHERWDGRGYPDKLKGDQIPVPAQIVSIADVYDALVSARIYKPAFTHVQAVKMITGGECGNFNPLLLDYFLQIQYKIKKLYKDN